LPFIIGRLLADSRSLNLDLILARDSLDDFCKGPLVCVHNVLLVSSAGTPAHRSQKPRCLRVFTALDPAGRGGSISVD
jgi:hypothetical protein